jgi:hypothetical protein
MSEEFQCGYLFLLATYNSFTYLSIYDDYSRIFMVYPAEHEYDEDSKNSVPDFIDDEVSTYGDAEINGENWGQWVFSLKQNFICYIRRVSWLDIKLGFINDLCELCIGFNFVFGFDVFC